MDYSGAAVTTPDTMHNATDPVSQQSLWELFSSGVCNAPHLPLTACRAACTVGNRPAPSLKHPSLPLFVVQAVTRSSPSIPTIPHSGDSWGFFGDGMGIVVATLMLGYQYVRIVNPQMGIKMKPRMCRPGALPIPVFLRSIR